MGTPQHFTVSALADEFGLDRRTVSKRIGKVEPVRTEGRSQLYLIKDVAPFLVEFVGDDGLDLHGQKTRLTKLQADKLQKDLAIQNEEFLHYECVDKAWAQHVIRCRSQLLVLPVKVAPLLINQKSSNVIADIVRKHLYQALTELGNGGKTMGEFIDRKDVDVIWVKSKRKLEEFSKHLASEFADRMISEPLEKWQTDWEKAVTERMDRIQAETFEAINAASFDVGDWKEA